MENHSPLDFEPLSEVEMVANARQFYLDIRRRRTVRHFLDKPIPPSVLKHAIMSAGTAPNGANKQPWHFSVIQSPVKKNLIRVAAEEEEREFYENRAPDEWLEDLAPLGTDANKPFLEIAPALIACFAQPYEVVDGKRRKNYYVNESVGIAMGFLIAALHASGLATLTHTPSPMKFLNEICGRPEYERPLVLLVVGYPAEDALVPDITKKPLDEIATFL